MALGSPLIRAIRDVALPGIVLSVSGLLIGCVLAGATAKLMKSIIWGIAPTDPATFMAAAGALLLVALISSVVPSLRVARINPADTLRD
jgi:ABC-type antimicrobial peptide transport system permease subunit